jgi:uncharacterized protein YggE
MKTTIAAVLATFLLFQAAPSPAQPAGDRGPSITVRGDGRAEVPPDIARLSVEVVTRGKTLETAGSSHKERAAKASTALRALAKDGLTIEQSNFRLDQVRQPVPQQGPRQETEYQAVTSYELKTKKLDTIDAVIAAIADTGLFEMRNVRFGLDEKSNALDMARRDAVADARQRAKVYAEAAGVQLGDVTEITDSEPRMLREFAAPMAARGMQVAPPETIAATAHVTMTWRLKQP